jgi:hypothetical protein
VIRHSQRFLAGALALIAFIIWATRGFSLARSFLAARSPSPVAYWEFGAWIFAGVLLVTVFLWVVFGREKLHIGNGKLSVEADLFGLTFYRSEPLMISDTRNLRFEKYGYGFKGNRVTRYRLAAEFDGAQRNLLSDLSENQAGTLMQWGPLAKLQSKGELSGPEQRGF